MTDKKTSTIGLILRTKKTKASPYGIRPVSQVPADDVCVVCLGGNDSRSNKAANGNASIVNSEVVDYLDIKIPVYSVRYDFGDDDAYGQYARYRSLDESFVSSAGKFQGISKMDFSLTRKNVTSEFKRHLCSYLSYNGKRRSLDSIDGNLRGIKIYIDDNPTFVVPKLNKLLYSHMEKLGFSKQDADFVWERLSNCVAKEHSEYITDLFNATLLPRISENGERVSLDVASRRIRKINFVAHCHGAFVAQQMEKMAREKMTELGYTPREIKQILSQLLVVAHAPSCRFENTDAMLIGFMSAFDTVVDTPLNWVRAYIEQRRKQDIKYMVENKKTRMKHEWIPANPIYLNKKYGNMFMIARGFDFNLNTANASPDEHDNTHYESLDEQNADGYYLNMIAADILSSAIENSLKQSDGFVPLPPINELMHRPDADAKTIDAVFDSMKRDGNKFIADVYKFASENVKKMRGDKPIMKKVSNINKI